MPKARRLLLSAVAVGIATSYVGYVLLNPPWRTASLAEVRAAVPQELLATEPADPKAVERMDRFAETLRRIPHDLPWIDSIGLADRFLATSGKELDGLDSIVSAGPLRHLPSPPARTEIYVVDFELDVVRCLAQCATQLARAHRSREALAAFQRAYRITEALLASSESMLATTAFLDRLEDLDSQIAESLRCLEERELAVLAKITPSSEGGARHLARSLRNDFQTRVLPILPDPAQWARAHTATGDFEQFAETPDQRFHGGLSAMHGRYDALETTRAVAKIYQVELENLRRPINRQSDLGPAYWLTLASSLPANPAAGAVGWDRWFKQIGHRWELARIPNSFGKFLILATNPIGLSARIVASQRTEREGLRTVIALRRYRLRFAKRAPRLEALVKVGLLSSLPTNYDGDAPFTYSASRGTLVAETAYLPLGKRTWRLTSQDGVVSDATTFVHE